jgi:hypothetical protein
VSEATPIAELGLLRFKRLRVRFIRRTTAEQLERAPVKGEDDDNEDFCVTVYAAS